MTTNDWLVGFAGLAISIACLIFVVWFGRSLTNHKR